MSTGPIEVLRSIAEQQQQVKNAYYDWIKVVVTIASGTLALMVGLHDNYQPEELSAVIVLKTCWFFLGLTVFVGIYALKIRAIEHNRTIIEIKSLLKKDDPISTLDILGIGIVAKLSKKHIAALKSFPVLFGVSFALLLVFAIGFL